MVGWLARAMVVAVLGRGGGSGGGSGGRGRCLAGRCSYEVAGAMAADKCRLTCRVWQLLLCGVIVVLVICRLGIAVCTKARQKQSARVQLRCRGKARCCSTMFARVVGRMRLERTGVNWARRERERYASLLPACPAQRRRRRSLDAFSHSHTHTLTLTITPSSATQRPLSLFLRRPIHSCAHTHSRR